MKNKKRFLSAGLATLFLFGVLVSGLGSMGRVEASSIEDVESKISPYSQAASYTFSLHSIKYSVLLESKGNGKFSYVLMDNGFAKSVKIISDKPFTKDVYNIDYPNAATSPIRESDELEELCIDGVTQKVYSTVHYADEVLPNPLVPLFNDEQEAQNYVFGLSSASYNYANWNLKSTTKDSSTPYRAFYFSNVQNNNEIVMFADKNKKVLKILSLFEFQENYYTGNSSAWTSHTRTSGRTQYAHEGKEYEYYAVGYNCTYTFSNIENVQSNSMKIFDDEQKALQYLREK